MAFLGHTARSILGATNRWEDRMAIDGGAPGPGFETDFWRDASARKSWDDLVPGEPRRTLPYI
jgi:hypothetical protein